MFFLLLLCIFVTVRTIRVIRLTLSRDYSHNSINTLPEKLCASLGRDSSLSFLSPFLHSYELCLLCKARCLKITGKVSFNIASEARNIYILMKNAKNGQFAIWQVFENLKLAVKQCNQIYF